MMKQMLIRAFSTGRVLQAQGPSAASAAHIIYRTANKKDKKALQALASRYIMQDEHYKGLGGTVEETQKQWDYLIRDALRYPYTMVAYDREEAVGFSLITNRHREYANNRFDVLGPIPPRTKNFSLLCDVCDHAEKEFWNLLPTANSIFVAEAIYVDPDYRRLQVGSTLVGEQFHRLSQLLKRGCDMDGMIAVATSHANMCQLEKLGFMSIYDIPPEHYRRPDGSFWKSADSNLPYGKLMYLKC